MPQSWRFAQWNQNNWQSQPPWADAGNGDAIIEMGTNYTYSIGGNVEEVCDFQVNIPFYWAQAPGVGTWLTISFLDTGVDAGSIVSNLGYHSANTFRFVVATNAQESGRDMSVLLNTQRWYVFEAQIVGSVFHAKVGGERHWYFKKFSSICPTQIQVAGSNCVGTTLLLGAGVGADMAMVATRNIGAAEYTAGWTAPATADSVMRLVPLVDRYGMGTSHDQFCEVTFQYKTTVNDTWAVLPDDGDISSEGASGGDTVYVRIDDGNGTGMDNYRDMRLSPAVYGFEVAYTDVDSDEILHARRRNALRARGR